MLDYQKKKKKDFIFFIEVDGTPFISFIFDSHYPGTQSKGCVKKSRKKNKDRIFHCPKKCGGFFFFLSIRTKKALVLRGMNNDLSVSIHMERSKFMERLSVGLSLLNGKIYRGMILITVFFLQLFEVSYSKEFYKFLKKQRI